MEPRIQYAQTKDGVSIAYWTMGGGEPFVHMPSAFGSSSRSWQVPGGRQWHERLAERRQLVRYDNRGFGHSQRDATHISLETQLLDLEAVLEHLNIERFVLFGGFFSGPAAITYAARHAERVSRLILWQAVMKGSDSLDADRVRALLGVADVDWEVYTETVARTVLGWTAGEAATRYAEVLRESTTAKSLRAGLEALFSMEVQDEAMRIKCSTLVLLRRQPSQEAGRRVAATIPGAKMAIVEGASIAPYVDDREGVLRAIAEFLGDAVDEPAAVELPDGTAIILFADIADSTALTERLGDAAFREKQRRLDVALRTAITGAAGTAVEGKVLGDGVMAVFTSARQAIDCAIRCRSVGEKAGLPLHLGVHAGDVIREGNNVHGGAVNLAARIADASEPGAILVSDTVRGLARTSAGVQFEDRGEHELKGIREPQRLYEVRWREDA